jgi:hypothetical protein
MQGPYHALIVSGEGEDGEPGVVVEAGFGAEIVVADALDRFARGAGDVGG